VIRILIADDHAMVRMGLETLLSSYDDFEVVGSAKNGSEVVAMVESDPPDVVLMDVAMPVMDGVAATEAVAMLFPNLPIIVLSTFADPLIVKQVLTAGATGYLLKDVEPDALASGIRAALEGGAPLNPLIAAQLIGSGRAGRTIAGDRHPVSPASGTLTVRERQILEHIAGGNSNKQIARLLGISELTVKSHCGRLFKRLGVTDRTQAAVWATKYLNV
jgi:DNA-binding NarL/FixJ family response regulator